jgi:hypothetical protein
MDSAELIGIIRRGESSKVQFKERMPHIDSLAHELIAEELPVNGSSTKDIDLKQFGLFLFKKYKKTLEELESENLSIEQILENQNLAKNGAFLLTGLLLFSAKRHLFIPNFRYSACRQTGQL